MTPYIAVADKHSCIAVSSIDLAANNRDHQHPNTDGFRAILLFSCPVLAEQFGDGGVASINCDVKGCPATVVHGQPPKTDARSETGTSIMPENGSLKIRTICPCRCTS